MLKPLLLLCALACGAAAAPDPARLARSVTVHRDGWGVPHIYGPSDASVVFGLMYAQAEDNFWQLEETFIRDLGRAAEVHGPSRLRDDLMVRLFESERLAKEEMERAAPASRALYEAFAAGLNWYLHRHPEVKPRLIARFEPWHILALHHSPPSLARLGIRHAEIAAAYPGIGAAAPPEAEAQDEGSNMWAVAPARSASGRALLLINPHVGFFGGGQRYEAHLRSGQGLNVAGFAILGTPYIRSGHNERLGWSHTNNYADVVDVYSETFDDTLTYRYGQGRRQAAAWTTEIRVKTDAGFETRRFTLRKTHHGPIVAVRDGHPLAVRRHAPNGLLEQRWAMARARSLAEFKAAMARLTLTGSNTLYADRAGHIFYLHGNAIPRRATRYDWSRPVDGSDPETEWQGLHRFEELPQILNPPSGWLQNCNSTVFLSTAEGNPRRQDYPAYMVPEPDTLRAQRSREILSRAAKFGFEEFARAALDTTAIKARTVIPKLLAVPAPPELTPLLTELNSWDYVSTVDSVAMTLYMAIEKGGDPMAALAAGKAALEKDWGTWRVPWGEINRLQRIHTSGTLENFSDARPSLPVPAAPGTVGCLFAYNTRTVAGQKRVYGTSGNTFVSAVEFGKKPRAVSVLVFGQTADPASPHWFDQGRLYAEKKYKPAWFETGEVKRNAKRTYHP